MRPPKNYNPAIHHRRSIRLQGFDYTQGGLYFITICCKDRACLFGAVKNGTMELSSAGEIVNACWQEIPDHFPNVLLHEYIIMPNHVHGIIELANPANDGAGHISPAPDVFNDDRKIFPTDTGTTLRSPSKTIGSIVRGFKIGVTKWFRANGCYDSIWQRNYYEHIIKDEKSYLNIAAYIINNPVKWQEDKWYMK